MKHYSLAQRIISWMCSQQTFCKLHFASWGWGSVAQFLQSNPLSASGWRRVKWPVFGPSPFSIGDVYCLYMYIWRIKQGASAQAKRCVVTKGVNLIPKPIPVWLVERYISVLVSIGIPLFFIFIYIYIYMCVCVCVCVWLCVFYNKYKSLS